MPLSAISNSPCHQTSEEGEGVQGLAKLSTPKPLVSGVKVVEDRRRAIPLENRSVGEWKLGRVFFCRDQRNKLFISLFILQPSAIILQ